MITNLDERMTGDEYAPYAWHREDAEALSVGRRQRRLGPRAPGLHHCASPHRALGELLRVGRKGAIVFEARDSLVVRAGVRLGLVEEYEVTAVAANDGGWGGVRNGPVPNHVYRWTEREVRKTVRSLLPAYQHDIRFAYGLRRAGRAPGPTAPASVRRRQATGARSSNDWRPVRATSSPSSSRKNVRPQPWLRERLSP